MAMGWSTDAPGLSDREARIGFLVLEDEVIRLCWLVCIQPFEKKEFDVYEDYEIVETQI